VVTLFSHSSSREAFAHSLKFHQLYGLLRPALLTGKLGTTAEWHHTQVVKQTARAYAPRMKPRDSEHHLQLSADSEFADDGCAGTPRWAGTPATAE